MFHYDRRSAHLADWEKTRANVKAIDDFAEGIMYDAVWWITGEEIFAGAIKGVKYGYNAWKIGKNGTTTAKGIGLSDDIARTFAGGRYSKVVLDKPMTLSRYYDNVGAFAKGRYMTNPSSITGFKFADRMGLALKPQWNGMTKVANWNLPTGTTIYQGRAAMQFPWIGGRTQYFVPNLNNIQRVIR